jgi:hypothetical protein
VFRAERKDWQHYMHPAPVNFYLSARTFKSLPSARRWRLLNGCKIESLPPPCDEAINFYLQLLSAVHINVFSPRLQIDFKPNRRMYKNSHSCLHSLWSLRADSEIAAKNAWPIPQFSLALGDLLLRENVSGFELCWPARRR